VAAPPIGEGRGRRLLSRCRCLSPSASRPGISAPSRSPHAWMARKPTWLHRSASAVARPREPTV